MKYDFSIVIPVYNEEGNLPSLMDSLIELRDKLKWNCEIVIVNDNSSDNTPEICDKLVNKYNFIIAIHRVKGNNGMGYALIEGTKKANGKNILWTMGDKSDDVNTYDEIIEALNKYDVVFGSRYMKGGSRGDLGMEKAFLSEGYTFLCRGIFGIPVHDITNAFRGFKKEVFNNINLESGDFAISPEFAIKSHLKGYKLGEVPTRYTDRKAGKGKFKMMKMGIRYVSLFKYKLFKNSF